MQSHTIQRQLTQVDRVSAVAAREMRMRLEPDLAASRMLIYREVEVTSDGVPFENVAATIAARNATGTAHAKMHLATGPKQVFHHLAT